MNYKGNKSYLPYKICAGCAREFSWQKKWKLNWTSVRYCSEQCRKKRTS
ncbi:DUF2256 domain-containing protein [bacterium]|nr:MAG: DUF2256 domain-containing protein [bacterium]